MYQSKSFVRVAFHVMVFKVKPSRRRTSLLARFSYFSFRLGNWIDGGKVKQNYMQIKGWPKTKLSYLLEFYDGLGANEVWLKRLYP
jgi:hypothetical protein